MLTAQTLHQTLLRLDQQSYKAYQQIRGTYQFPGFTLTIDHVQGDPFAAPSRVSVRIPQPEAKFPAELYQSPSREIALRDYLNREFDRQSAQLREKRGSGKSGLIAIVPPKQAVLERSSVWINAQQVEVRFMVGLPARGRTILGRQAAELLCQDVPEIVRRSLFFAALNAKAVQTHVEVVEDADWLRSQLELNGLVAFIPDGAILPRQSGVNDQPMSSISARTPSRNPSTEQAIPFQSPDSLRVTFDRPNQGKITGMGIPKGVTLIVGGGYHGKSTLLKAISLGIYSHIPGDGREQLVTNATAMKIRAEDGRSIAGVDISPFINHLPQGRSTTQFSTENASGSTSQAANIIEALEAGAKVLLVDEDTSATNFMIRDRRMQALIAKNKEPITPFVDKIRQLYQDYGVSTILVMGGSGDYFEVADTVIAMVDFQPQNVTQQAKEIAAAYQTDRTAEGGEKFGSITLRTPIAQRLDSPQRSWQRDFRDSSSRDSQEYEREERSPKLKVRDVDELVFGGESIDLSAIEQLVEVGQIRAVGAAIAYIQQHYLDGKRSLSDILEDVMRDIRNGSLDALTPYPQGDLTVFRSIELAAAINRLRTLKVASHA
ncbi:ABC-ATPase domain-containing protein [Leptolyngbya ohadii]|uniref:ABC-ATPase domain-containing protein n=1 Tax=Leptolyngbya ohadii TaxID=1962290 RepID=UPI000B5A087B|nr:ABC-ATPase domain-containing protein [Leptolyngbya ohadii]